MKSKNQRVGVIFASFLISCGGAGGSGGDSAGGTDGVPDPYGGSCYNGKAGWQTPCYVDNMVVRFWDDNNILEYEVDKSDFILADEYPGNFACCEGCPNKGEADDTCTKTCMEIACQIAEDYYNSQLGLGCKWPFGSCPFPMGECTSHPSFLANITTGNQSDGQLAVSCWTSAPEIPDEGCWAPDPTQSQGCIAPELQERPTGGFAQALAAEGPGMSAGVSWVFGGSSGFEYSETVDASFGYRVVGCGPDRCLDLANLYFDVPDYTTAGGLHITNAHFIAKKLEPNLVLNGGSFVIAPNQLEVVLSANANGVPVFLSGKNDNYIYGHIDEAANIVRLPGMLFSYADSAISGYLFVDMHGTYTERPPQVDIEILSNPGICSQPVIFHAITQEFDGQQVSFNWDVDEIAYQADNILELELPYGSHEVSVVGIDSANRFGADSMMFTRFCR